jgi:hypothetical protein
MNTNFNSSFSTIGGRNNNDLIIINELIIPKAIYGSMNVIPFKFQRRQYLDFSYGRVTQNSRTFINASSVDTQDAITRAHLQTVPIVEINRVIEFCLLNSVCLSVTAKVEKTKGSGKSRRRSSPKLFLDLVMRWWRGVDMRRCFLANIGSDIRELKDLHRHRSCKSKFTGSLHRISSTSSKGRVVNSCFLLVAVVVSSAASLLYCATMYQYHYTEFQFERYRLARN